MSIGKNIKKARANAKLTQNSLAKKSGISEISIRKYESGERIPKIKTIEKIANALNIDLTILLDGYLIYENKIIENTPLNRSFLNNPNTAFANGWFEGIQLRQEEYDADIFIYYNELNTLGKQKAVERVQELTEIPRYTEPDPDDQPEAAKHDDDEASK